MSKNILVYYIGLLGIAGIGPHWIEPYSPDKTLGEVIQNMKDNNVSRSTSKKIKILKHESGDVSKRDKNDLYWLDDTKIIDYENKMGCCGNVRLIFCLVDN